MRFVFRVVGLVGWGLGVLSAERSLGFGGEARFVVSDSCVAGRVSGFGPRFRDAVLEVASRVSGPGFASTFGSGGWRSVPLRSAPRYLVAAGGVGAAGRRLGGWRPTRSFVDRVERMGSLIPSIRGAGGVRAARSTCFRLVSVTSSPCGSARSVRRKPSSSKLACTCAGSTGSICVARSAGSCRRGVGTVNETSAGLASVTRAGSPVVGRRSTAPSSAGTCVGCMSRRSCGATLRRSIRLWNNFAEPPPHSSGTRPVTFPRSRDLSRWTLAIRWVRGRTTRPVTTIKSAEACRQSSAASGAGS